MGRIEAEIDAIPAVHAQAVRAEVNKLAEIARRRVEVTRREKSRKPPARRRTRAT